MWDLDSTQDTMPAQQSAGGITTADWPQQGLSDPASAERRGKSMLENGRHTGVRVMGMSAIPADK